MFIKKSSGLVFDEIFNIDTWDLSNSSNVSVQDDTLFLLHGSLDTVALRDIPAEANFFEAIVDYTPTVSGDAGGLVLRKNTDEYVEMLEIKDLTQADLENIKAVRNGEQYDLYMYRNENFEYIDSVVADFLKIGFVAKAGDSSYEIFKVNRFVAAKNNELRITGLQEGLVVQLITDKKTLLATADVTGTAIIELEHVETIGTLQYLDSIGNTVYSLTDKFIGGDEYYIGSQLVIRQASKNLSTSSINNVGSIQSEKLELQLEVYNQTTLTIQNIRLTIRQYIQDEGYTWTRIAIDNNGLPGEYADNLAINSIGGEASQLFWIELKRPENSSATENIYFNIDLTHD